MLEAQIVAAFLAGFAVAIVPVWISAYALHSYVEWRNPLLFWAFSVKEMPRDLPRLISGRSWTR